MEKEKQEFLNNRFKAMNRVPFLLHTMSIEDWDFTSICKMFVQTVGYQSCWIAMMSDSGEIKNLSIYKNEDVFSKNYSVKEILFNDFVKESLVVSGDYILDKDPLLDYINTDGENESKELHSITIKLSYNNMIYGLLSISLKGHYDSLKEEVLILSDVVKSISFFIYDIDVRGKIKEIFVTMFETTGTGTALFEEDTTISYVNQEFELLSGYPKKEIEGKMKWTRFIHDDDISRMLEYHRKRRIDPKSAPRNYEFRFVDRYEKIKNIYMTIDMVPGTKVSIASFLNVTEKKQLESEVLKIGELERQQIGSDLHDGLSPHLVGVKFMLKVLKQKISGDQPIDKTEIDEIDNLISEALNQTRTLIKGLKPVDIQPDGLIYAIEELLEKSKNIYHIECKLSVDENILIDSNIVATHLYYIIQEALNNAIKHGKPSKIDVSVTKDEDILIVEITDNGTGLPKLLDTTKGFGLNIMKYRASIINGSIDYKNQSKGGVTVTCTLRIKT